MGNLPSKEEVMKMMSRDVRTGSARQALAEDKSLAEMFQEMTPEQKAHGKLIGRLLQARGNEAVEAAFTWFEQEHNGGQVLDYRHKMLCIFQAAESLGCSQQEYNLIRKMYLTVANRS